MNQFAIPKIGSGLSNPSRALWLTLLIVAGTAGSQACATTIRVYETRQQRYLTYSDWLALQPATATWVMGEMHYTPLVQETQAKIIKDHHMLNPQLTVGLGWEFLNFTDQAHIDFHYQRYLRAEISAETLLQELRIGGQFAHYAPVMQSLQLSSANLFGLNVERTVKRQVMDQGFASLAGHLRPPQIDTGSPSYFRRFEISMRGHAPANRMEDYFRAQYYTDAVMAWKAAQLLRAEVHWIIVGSFHSDFYDGMIPALRRQLPNRNLITLKLIDEGKYSSSEIQEFIQGHPQDGTYADYLLLMR